MSRETSNSPLTRILDFVGSVPFGVAVLILILAYCWIGSAGLYPIPNSFVRQMVEKTEMEWFSWWPFNTLIVLLCAAVIIISVRKIPRTLPKLGVWVVHIGIVVLSIGSFIYFGTKVEGDVAVFRRELVLSIPGGETRAMLLQPGAQTVVNAGATQYRVQVAEINPNYELLTGSDKGKKTASVNLMINPVQNGVAGRPFVRQLLMDYPQYTEDVIPGQGRAIKTLGRKLVDETLHADLRYHAADRFFVHHSMAIHARLPGREDWAEYVVDDPPHYTEHVSSADAAYSEPGEPPLAVKPFIEPAVLKAGQTAPLPDVSMRVIGYLPFATPDGRWVPGGNQFNPLARLSVEMGGNISAHTLLALDQEQNRVSLGDGVLDASFRWIDDPAEFQRALNPGAPALIVRVPGQHVSQEISLADAMDKAVPIGSTGYSVQGLEIYPRWSLAGGDRAGTPASMVLVRVTKAGATFMRGVVSPHFEVSQDIDETGQRMRGLIDSNIVIEAKNISDVGLVIVAGKVGLHSLLISRGGQVMHQSMELGKPASFFDNALRVTLDQVSPTSQRDDRPRLFPRRERDLKQLPFYSMVQLEIKEGASAAQTLWLPYSNFTYPTRTGYSPIIVTLPSGRELELIYSRRTEMLPSPVALEVFQLETFPGGTRERDYISLVRFLENGKWSETHQVHSNNPTEHAGLWYFQATWDPPEPQMGSAGLNFTGLGVGNRHAVWVMLLGCIMMAFGTTWAFYIKPVILRRLAAQGAERRLSAVPAASSAAIDNEEQPAATGEARQA
ncbi:MAG: hypothetical protein U0V87_04915 [Acidobacteriota bacterium]